ncbi:rap gtpase-activating protein [Anaeramoeba flamelloides]|uniref:Rap gtpase-activating protein n=1 Tax=Anaeramoeba flamelloides TaxID=1746091 RepID=A0AAV7Y3W2_9EUKA|nr:rap gtpase-activating protein [Anaeramoeba flamelloides]
MTDLQQLNQENENDQIKEESFEESLFDVCDTWRIEPLNQKSPLMNLQVFKKQLLFSDNFLLKDYHCLTLKSIENEFYLLTIHEDEEQDEFFCLLYSTKGAQIKRIKYSSLNISIFRQLLSLGPSFQEVLTSIDNSLSNAKIMECYFEREKEDLLTLERVEYNMEHKVGVLYVKDQQKNEKEILANQGHNKEFDEFIDLLGDRILLKGFEGFCGGMDTKFGSSGKESIHTKWNDFEIIFHVSTLIPYRKNDTQQVLRKKHIGNDIVLIVFLEKSNTFNPECLISKQNHVILAVQPIDVNGETEYR